MAGSEGFEGHVPEQLGVDAIRDPTLDGLLDGEDDEHSSESARGSHKGAVDGDAQEEVLDTTGGGLIPSQIHPRGAEMVDDVTPKSLSEHEGVLEDGCRVRRPNVDEEVLVRHDDSWLCGGVKVGVIAEVGGG